MELERVVEPERVVVQTKVASSIPPEPDSDRSSINELDDLADEVYIFANPNEPGIKFIDSKPNIQVEKIVGSNPDGVYTTPLSSIDVVMWDEDFNIPNSTTIVRYYNGSVKVKTIMVSEETLKAIIQDIDRQMQEGKSVIKIDIHILTRKNTINNNLILKDDQVLNEKSIGDVIDEYTDNNSKVFKTDDLKSIYDDKQILERYKKLYNEVKSIQNYIDVDDTKIDLDVFNNYNDDGPKSK